MILFSITTFLSSFLLFTVQLLVGKRVLPWFGGGASIWTTSMLFFMLFLFLGYLYVNFLSRKKKEKQIKLHLTLTALTFLVTGLNFWRYRVLVIPYPDWLSSVTSPSLQILLLIIASVGLPYLLLSTTSTLLQYWFSQNNPNKSPYFLYVISNIGSFLGLISYPLIIEAKFSLTNQENQWVILFFLYILFIIKIIRDKSLAKAQKVMLAKTTPIGKSKLIYWVSLSAISNIALLSVTSQITQSISPVPFLWILPLSLFLISFIIAFSGDRWYSRSFHMTLMLFVITAAVLVDSRYVYLPYWSGLFMTLFALFMINLVCHAELYKERPKASSLVPFYTSISFGGVIAAVFCAIIAPSLFPDLWEFPLSLSFPVLIYLFISITKTRKISLGFQKVFLGAGIVFLIFFLFRGYFITVYSNPNSKQMLKTRNFYGILRITDSAAPESPITRYLTNGKIDHGHQIMNGSDSPEPTSYYKTDSGGGLSILNHPKRTLNQPMRIGVIGLGVGTMAAYCQPDYTIRFYEINPKVVEISRQYFTFLSYCEQNGGKVEIVLGDARLSLDKELKEGNPQQFDVLIVDAFTDDAIPVHLITKEALELFNKHMASGGVVAYHISNQYLSLEKVLDKTTSSMGLYSFLHNSNTSVWYIISPWQLRKPFEFYSSSPDPKISLWTDDHSNILEVFRAN